VLPTQNQPIESHIALAGTHCAARVRTPPPAARHLSELFRYLTVGACNTAFGFGCYAFFTLLLTQMFSYGYVLASLLANLLSITFAFLGYKWFIFKTHGNYLKEWIRCLGVYASSMILSVTALPLVVSIIRREPGHDRSAPYIAGAIVFVFSVLVSSVVFSFFGQPPISFADRRHATHTPR
jgi:putative flippase GtrA